MNIEADPNRLLRIEEVAIFFGISRSTVYREIPKGSIPEPTHPTTSGYASRWVYSELLEARDRFRRGRRPPVQKKPRVKKPRTPPPSQETPPTQS